MTTPVSLQSVADEIDAMSQDWTAKLNRRTGEIVGAESQHWTSAEEQSDEELAALPEWERLLIQNLRKTLESPEWVTLPDKHEFHEYKVMERFSRLQESAAREELLEAIAGSGAFSRFKRVIERLDLRAGWFSHRNDALLRFTGEWLTEESIPFRK